MNKHLTVNWNDIFVPSASVLETIMRGSLVYLSLFILTRIVIKRRIGGISMTNVLVMVLLADAMQNSMANELKSVADGVILVSTILFWNYALDWLSFRSPFMEKLLRPVPLLLVEDGKVLRRNMREELVTMDELMNKLREQGLEDVQEVKQAHLEADGEISILRNDNQESENPPEKTKVF